jgi:hypothetical protein
MNYSPNFPDESETIPVTRVMLHDLVNHLTIALGHGDLLLLETDPHSPAFAALNEIRDACLCAVAVVEDWRSHFPSKPV